MAGAPRVRHRVCRASEGEHISPYLFGVVDSGANLQVGSALRAYSDIDFEYALQHSCSAMIFYLMLIDRNGIEALAGLGLKHNEISPFAV